MKIAMIVISVFMCLVAIGNFLCVAFYLRAHREEEVGPHIPRLVGLMRLFSLLFLLLLGANLVLGLLI